jgi:4-amino-4-deoxy-L-arabinose transferase-like glycosyltransferase
MAVVAQPAARAAVRSSARTISLVALAVLILAGAVLRLANLDSQTLGHIEMYVPGINLPAGISVPAPRLTFWDAFTGPMREEVHPPTWYSLMWVWTRAFGTSEFAMRLPSALLGIGSIALVYVLGALERGRLVGVIAAGLFALNGQLIWWGHIAKPEAWTGFIGVLSTILLVHLARSTEHRQRQLIAYLAVTFLGLGSLYYYWPIAAAQLLWIVLVGWRGRLAVAGLVRWIFAAILLASPVMYVAMEQLRDSYLDGDVLRNLTQFFTFGYLFEPDVFGDVQLPSFVTPYFLIGALALGVVLFGAGLLASSTRAESRGLGGYRGPGFAQLAAVGVFATAVTLLIGRFVLDGGNGHFRGTVIPLLVFIAGFVALRSAGLASRLAASLVRAVPLAARLGDVPVCALLAIVPVALVTGVDVLVTPFFASRQMNLYLPYVLVVMAAGAVKLASGSGRRALALPLLAILLLLAPVYYAGIEYAWARTLAPSPTDYRGLAQQLLPRLHDSDLIFVQPHWVTTPLFYYVRADQHAYVGADYLAAIDSHPNARVWVVTFEGLDHAPGIDAAVTGWQAVEQVGARRVSAELYDRVP